MLVVINYGNFAMAGRLKEKTETELVLNGALTFQGGAPGATDVPEFSLFPLGAPNLTPDPELETRLLLTGIHAYTLLPLDSTEQDLCVKYRSFWDTEG